MHDMSEIAYLTERANVAREMALKANHPGAARSHSIMAVEYEKRINNAKRQTLHLVSS